MSSNELGRVVVFRLTAAQARAIDRLAQEKAKSRAGFIRSTLISALDLPRLSTDDRALPKPKPKRIQSAVAVKEPAKRRTYLKDENKVEPWAERPSVIARAKRLAEQRKELAELRASVLRSGEAQP